MYLYVLVAVFSHLNEKIIIKGTSLFADCSNTYFNCIKFRTMVNNADEMLESMMDDSPLMREEFTDNFKLKRDPRITNIGYFLRLTSLDEFPQIMKFKTKPSEMVSDGFAIEQSQNLGTM